MTVDCPLFDADNVVLTEADVDDVVDVDVADLGHNVPRWVETGLDCASRGGSAAAPQLWRRTFAGCCFAPTHSTTIHSPSSHHTLDLTYNIHRGIKMELII